MNKTIFEYDMKRLDRGSDRSFSALLHSVSTNIPAHFKVLVSDIIALSISLLCASTINLIISNPEGTVVGLDAIVGNQILGRYMLFLPVLILVFLYGGLYSRRFWEGRELQRVV